MNQDLKRLIKDKRKTAFVEGAEASDAEVLGVLISQYFDWDGWQITQAFASALEDANFHSLNSKIAKLVEKEGFISGQLEEVQL